MKDTASISQANKISLTRKLILCLRQCCWKTGNGLWRRQQERASLCMLESLLQYCWELREFSRLRPFSLTKQAFSDILWIKSFCYSRRWLPWCQGCQESKHDSDAVKNACCPSTESVSHFSQSTIHSSSLISKLCLCILTRKQSFHLNRNSMEQTRWWLGLGWVKVQGAKSGALKSIWSTKQKPRSSSHRLRLPFTLTVTLRLLVHWHMRRNTHVHLYNKHENYLKT